MFSWVLKRRVVSSKEISMSLIGYFAINFSNEIFLIKTPLRTSQTEMAPDSSPDTIIEPISLILRATTPEGE